MIFDQDKQYENKRDEAKFKAELAILLERYGMLNGHKHSTNVVADFLVQVLLAFLFSKRWDAEVKGENQD